MYIHNDTFSIMCLIQYFGIVKIRNTSETVIRLQYILWPLYQPQFCGPWSGQLPRSIYCGFHIAPSALPITIIIMLPVVCYSLHLPMLLLHGPICWSRNSQSCPPRQGGTPRAPGPRRPQPNTPPTRTET